MNLWEFFLYMFWFYILISCIVILFRCFVDVFRDHTMNGWAKAGWIIFLIAIPLLAALIYLVVRGRSMAARDSANVVAAQQAQVGYIQSVAGTTSSVDEIAKAKTLLDSGALTQAEYDAVKAKALA
jgi:hypothetical protein